MLIRCRNREWSNVARASTLRTAAFIVTASKCAPITLRPTSSENGEIVAARRAITFSSSRCFLAKCVWARTSRTSARARPRNRRARLQLALPLLKHHRVEEQVPPRQLHRKEERQPLLLQHPEDRQQRLQVRPHQSHQQVLLLRLLLQLHLPQQSWRMQVRPHHQPRQQERHGQFKPLASRRCTPLPGTMCIFIRRAASMSIRTCRPIVFSMKSTASVTRARRTRCSSPDPTRHPKAGKLFPVSMRNVWSLT